MPSKKAVHVQHPPTYSLLGVRMTIHLSGAQTGGEFSIIGATMPPGGDGGLHMHTHEDESLCMLEGELEVTIGEETLVRRSGESYFAPRNIAHRLRNRGKATARALLINTPGTFDQFVRAAGVSVDTQTSPSGPPDSVQIQRLLDIASEFGVTILAPPELTSGAAPKEECRRQA